jgi:hypothetical protein
MYDQLTANEPADFLRQARGSIDDSITQHLNALVTPGPFSRKTGPRQYPTSRPIAAQTCDSFKDQVLFPGWQARTDVLNYCAAVASAPDPDDPGSVAREIEDAKARDRVVDERLDPYSGRYFPRAARTEALASLLRNERAVETIIRCRTWSLVGERCGMTSQTAEEALEHWRTRRRRNENKLDPLDSVSK